MKTTPASKKQIKTWRKLQKKKYRYEFGQFIAEGERCVQQILRNGQVEVHSILATSESRLKNLIPETDTRQLPVYTLGEGQIREISDTDSPQGVLAVCSIPGEASPENLRGKTGFLVAADSLQDPGNLGTMIRTAVWFGANGLICGTGTVDPWHPKVVRSTAGATGALPVLKGSLSELFTTLESDGWQVLLLDGGEGAVALQTASQFSKSVLVVGNEATGIDESLLCSDRKRLKIEGDSGTVESLNAAMAAGIAMYWLSREKFYPDY